MEGNINDLIEAGILDKDFAQVQHNPKVSKIDDTYQKTNVKKEENQAFDLSSIFNLFSSKGKKPDSHSHSHSHSHSRSPSPKDRIRPNRYRSPTRNRYRDHRCRSPGHSHSHSHSHSRSRSRSRSHSPVRNRTKNSITGDIDQYYYYVKYHWLYAGKNNSWWHYDKESNEKLEDEYMRDNNECSIYIRDTKYKFDFINMTQCGTNPRNILRVDHLRDIALKGIAGKNIETGLFRKKVPPESDWVPRENAHPTN